MIDAIVLDVETLNNPSAIGWATSGLGVGVAVVYESRRDRFTCYGQDDVEALKDRIRWADIVAGFNIWAFDLPVIYGIDKRDWPASSQASWLRGNSLILDARRLLMSGLGLNPNGGATGAGTNLDATAVATLGIQAAGGKMLDSAALPDMIREGSPAGILAAAFECTRHVALERDLCRFMLRHGYAIAGDYRRAELLPDGELWAAAPLFRDRLGAIFGSDLV